MALGQILEVMGLRRSAPRAMRGLAGVALALTVVLAVYAAQPWGDNYAYQRLSDYLMLGLFLGWAVSPYAYLVLSARFHSGHRGKHLVRVAVASLVCVGGVAVVVDAIFVHPDAQGGLIFLSLPFFQWLVVGVLDLVLVLVPAKGRIDREAGGHPTPHRSRDHR